MCTACHRLRRPFAGLVGIFIVVTFIFSAPIHAADVGSVRRVVDDPHGHPMTQAGVKLKSATSDWVQSTSTDERGEFAFMTVPLGDYVLSVAHADFSTVSQAVAVGSGSSPTARIRLATGAAVATVTVTA
ncbi:MAG: carboxypeptidase regulatory-like domain-containing protein, partial [Steroidobacteraceae bacterium]